MDKLRRAIASIGLVAMLSTLVVSTAVNAGTFTDVPDTEWYASSVEALVTAGIVDSTNPNYRPGDMMNRAEGLKLAVEACGAAGSTDIDFPDVPVDAWFYSYVQTGVANGIISGDNPTFRPGDNVTRAEFAKMLVNACDLPDASDSGNPFPDVGVSDWFHDTVLTAYWWMVVDGYPDGTFGPANNILRAEAAKMTSAVMDPTPREGGVTPPPTPTAGDVTVSLNPSTPGVQPSVPGGATGVSVAMFDFTAGPEGATLGGLTVKRVGVGNPEDFAKVYLYHDGMKLGNGKSVNTSTNEAIFSNFSVDIAPNATETFEVRVDIETSITDSGVHAFQVTDADMVVSSALEVLGEFPVTGNNFGTSTVDAGSVDVESAGTDYTRKVGEKDVEVGGFVVRVDNEEDATMHGITLYNDKDDVLSNYTLWRGSEKVADGVVDGRYIDFELDTALNIGKGDSISFKVRADVGGKQDDSAELYVRYNTDVRVEGNTYGFNLFVDADIDGGDSYVDEAYSAGGGSTPDAVSSNTTTVEAGQITVSFNGPAATDVSKDSNNVPLINFSITSQANVDVEKMGFTLDGSGGVIGSEINDLDLFCDGVLVANEASPTVSATNAFTDTWSINAGETVDCVLEVDIDSTADDGDTLYATINAMSGSSSAWTFRDTDTNDTISDIVPSGDIEGNTMTITEASLDIDVASSPSGGNTYVAGAQGVDVVGLAFSAGDSDDVTVNSVLLTAYTESLTGSNWGEGDDFNANSGAEDVMGSVCIYEAETMTLLDNCDSLNVNASDITVQFDTLNWTIPAGESRTLLAQVGLNTTAPLDNNDDYIALAIATSTAVDAEYGTGTTVPVTLNSGNEGSSTTHAPDVYQTVVAIGDLDMSLSGDTPSSNLIVAGDVATVAQAEFAATNESFNVTKLRVEGDGTNGGIDEYDSFGLGYYDEMGVYQEAWQSPVLDGTSTYALADFTLDPPIFVEKDGLAYVDVLVDTKLVTEGADNDDSFRIGINADDNFEAVGVSSTDKLSITDTNTDITGEEFWVLETFPEITVDNSWTTTSPNISPSTEMDLFYFGITNPSSTRVLSFENVLGNYLDVEIFVNGHNTMSATLYDSTNSKYIDVLNDQDVSSGQATFQFDLSSTVYGSQPLSIQPGKTNWYWVYADTSNLATSGDFIQARLLESTTTGVDFGIQGSGSYNHSDIIFRADESGQKKGPGFSRVT